MSDPEAVQPLRDVIAATAADLSNGNPFWTAGCLAAALIPALDAAGWQIVRKPEFPCDDLRGALGPFLFAAAVGWSVEHDVDKAQPDQKTDRPLIAFASYAGQYAAQSRVSWADWKRLLDAADKSGLLDRISERAGE